MGCLFDCFRAAGGEPRGGRARAQLVSSSVIPAAYPKVIFFVSSSSGMRISWLAGRCRNFEPRFVG